MSNAEDLDVFQKSHSLAVDLYELTKDFPDQERYGLVDQIRRSASSINANLMEGSHRNTDGEYKQFIGIARGSVGELKYHLLLAKDLDYITKERYLEFKKETSDISRMLTGLIGAVS
ncbi:four helix bundle protein [Halanaerobaculum tunisiense]